MAQAIASSPLVPLSRLFLCEHSDALAPAEGNLILNQENQRGISKSQMTYFNTLYAGYNLSLQEGDYVPEGPVQQVFLYIVEPQKRTVH